MNGWVAVPSLKSLLVELYSFVKYPSHLWVRGSSVMFAIGARDVVDGDIFDVGATLLVRKEEKEE